MSSNDKQIEEYRVAVEKKRTELGEQPRPSYLTNQLLQLDPNDNKKLNLNLVNNETHCVEVVRQITIQSMAHDKANELLGTSIPFVIGGYTVEQWVGDVKARLELINWKAEKVKLDAMDKKLAALLSDDAKTANAIADIVGELNL